MKIGFIGLGNMGRHMARHLILAGHDVTVHDVRPEAALDHLGLGARWVDSPATCADGVDVLITMLPTPGVVEDVLLRGGAAEALSPGALWIDMSTSTPAAAQRIAEEVLDARGVRRLDAPVSGMARGAEAGLLQIFVGGDAGDFREVLPLLEVLGDPAKILHVGAVGHGYTVKLMINLLWFGHLVAAAEVLAVGVKAGVDLGVLRSALLAGPAASHFLEHDVLSVLADGDYDDSFAMVLACKDLGLAVDLARDVGVPAELAALVERIFRRAKAAYGDRAGEMSPVRLYEKWAGQDFRLPLPTVPAV
ncbi:3-hydroxyisobutyrate dehydrogenase [Amycolatopsis mediterranei S699]|uniref:3-hydroxyisobutyrate dehydrogenase n=2 Tax=Amycolatopsis mediterranei TaxID=33910 RepID=A0A0H3DCJ3_AMYMU|nr:NAD(P)-dependent oxidoreductase [Amycolatopsis mediterranei]ADJ47942.1 3-hydroxyisobutyrate dehydrogenase [Amycolatopsis mediterranei U32]AEK44842.1 3-hydroxyisobutyrate dehydrogenase [Amycolatopsis mediterranei S699]AFO79653.1 3-hydroxyisobutyrate dehydrogenase [Amycolatopsis mediterranei S699]AGT86781.1 3-hydroxyisobutyrate dehydrogenase [Amycolatopsis mediterranei RB]KDO10763.1 3-hydroxyisobutyrate dehydrogenase [Amycolatopsis mediterranei]